MIGEIDNNFYCITNYIQKNTNIKCYGMQNHNCDGCIFKRHKWPTLEQFREEYGKEWDGPVYIRDKDEYLGWFINSYKAINNYLSLTHIVCACTPWGKPPNDWIPK